MTLIGRIISWPFLLLCAIPQDKLLHIWIGSILAMSALRLGWYGALPVIIYAVSKELWDAAFPARHTADMWDALATIAGGAIPFSLIMLHRIYP